MGYGEKVVGNKYTVSGLVAAMLLQYSYYRLHKNGLFY